MRLEGKRIGFCLTGSFCTFKKVIEEMKNLINQKATIIPIMSYNAYSLDTRFGKAKDFITEIEDITKHKILHDIISTEPIGPKNLTDIMIISPCTRKYNIKTCE